MTERFLSLKEVGERLGVKNPAAKGYNLPEPDALIGATRGWLPETIDRWCLWSNKRVRRHHQI